MIDLHTHLLPGVDDGSPSIEASVPVLERFADEGVEVVVCTPHLSASRAALAPIERHREIFEALRAAAPAVPELRLGWEIKLDRPGCDLSASILSLGGSRAVLVEFPRGPLPMGTFEEILRLRQSGIVPVIAHPERYERCTIDLVRTWAEAGALIQTDATILLASGRQNELARELLAEGLVDCLASDNHGDRRSLGAARVWLEEIGAGEQAEMLTRSNPRRVLENQSVERVDPIRFDKGMLARLRQLLSRRRS